MKRHGVKIGPLGSNCGHTGVGVCSSVSLSHLPHTIKTGDHDKSCHHNVQDRVSWLFYHCKCGVFPIALSSSKSAVLVASQQTGHLDISSWT